MLEALTPETLRERLRFAADPEGAPAIGSVADAARACVRSWRSPARARVTAYLHRQFMAAGFAEDAVRARVGDVVDALIDIGDVTPVRLSGKASLVQSRPQWVRIGDAEHAFLGQEDVETALVGAAQRYARSAALPPTSSAPTDFDMWVGPAGFHGHLARRTGGTGDSALSELWAVLSAAVRHDGQPLDASQLRAVVDPPGAHHGRFGRHNLPTVSGRWKTEVPDGTWCAVRPGRNANEWHPILVRMIGTEVRSLDLYDWDEWNWALLARGVAIGAPERMTWADGRLSFEHPVPAQFKRALRLLGGPGTWAWTWSVSEGAHAAFLRWRDAL